MRTAYELNATGSMAVPVIMLALIVASVVVLALVIWSIKRHRNPDLHIECDSPIDKLLPSLAGLSLGTAVDGRNENLAIGL